MSSLPNPQPFCVRIDAGILSFGYFWCWVKFINSFIVCFFFSWEHTSVPRGREKNSATSSPRWERLHTSRLDTFPSPPPNPYNFSTQSESQVKLPRGGHLNWWNKLGRLLPSFFLDLMGHSCEYLGLYLSQIWQIMLTRELPILNLLNFL